MGEEIGTAGFRREDFAHFADRLAEETAIARDLFANNWLFSIGSHARLWEPVREIARTFNVSHSTI